MRLAQQAFALGVLPQHGFQLLECVEHVVGPGPAPVVVLVRHYVLCSSSPRFVTQFGRISGQHAVVPPVGGRSAPTPNSYESLVGHPRWQPTRTASTSQYPKRPASHTMRASGTNFPATWVSATEQDRRTVPEQALVGRDGHPGPLHLVPGGGAPELPDALADLGDRLGRDGLAEAGEAARGVDGHPAPQGRGAVAEQLLGLALAAQADVLVPVELERGREVVDLGQADVLGADPGLGVGRRGDGRPEARGGRCRSVARPSRRPSRSRSSASR